MTTACLVAVRAIHIGACLLFFGGFAFDCFVMPKEWQSPRRRFSLILLPVILLSGLAWFALVSMTMSGEALDAAILRTVWSQTRFGAVSKWRLIFWVAASAFTSTGLQRFHRMIFIWSQFFFAGLLLGSLAWAGHGQEDSGWHLLADILHLLVAGFWPAGLLPLALFLHQQRRNSEPERWIGMARVVRRFSAISLGGVALLVFTGWVNAWFLAGSVANLLGQSYGRWLLAKIILFLITVAIGAVNLLRLKPRLSVGKSQGQELEPVAAQLQFNVHLELLLTVVIVIIVGILGILPPAGR